MLAMWLHLSNQETFVLYALSFEAECNTLRECMSNEDV